MKAYILFITFTLSYIFGNAQNTVNVTYEPPQIPSIKWTNPKTDTACLKPELYVRVFIKSNRALSSINFIHNSIPVAIDLKTLKKINGGYEFEHFIKLQYGNNVVSVNVTNNGGKFANSLRNIEYIQGLQSRVWAVIIGISRYERKGGLNFSDDDAHRLNTFLSSPEGGAVPDKQRVLLIDEKATKNRILTDLKNTFAKATENDLVLFYFSGHGANGYFIPYDYNNQSYTFLYHTEIMDIFNNCKANKKLFIADACHSGSSIGKSRSENPTVIINEYYQGISSYSGFAFITSSKGEEESQEINYYQQGVFSYFLIEGLKGKADSDNSDHFNKITLGELFDYIYKNVCEETNNTQTPQMKCYNRDMIIGIVRKK